MERRKFLLGVGGSAIGGGALLGSGAFTRIESQRRVKIEVAEDPDAYLGLDGCPGSPNSSYTNIDDSGHLEIDMSSDNPTEGGGQGVNSDSYTYFDDVFQICNQGKEKVGIWIDDTDWPVVGEGEDLDDEYDEYLGENRVEFYIDGDEDDSILGDENAFPLGVGQCVCIGLRTLTKGLESGDQLLSDLGDEIVINADTDNLGELDDRVDPESMNITGMCSHEIDGEEYFLWRIRNENNFPVNVRYECTAHDVSGALDVPANVVPEDGDDFKTGYYFLTDVQCDPIILNANGTEVGRNGIDPDKECEEFEKHLINYLTTTGEDSVRYPQGTITLDGDSPGLGPNDDNREKNRPYVDWMIDDDELELVFNNPTNHLFAFDYRVDDKPEGTEDQWTGDTIGQGPLEGEDFGLRYNGVTVDPGESESVTVHPVKTAEFILRRGAEQEWYIPWVTFNVE